MHCKDKGKLFAAVTDRQKTDISLTLKVGLAGLILESSATFSDTGVPAKNENLFRHESGTRIGSFYLSRYN